MITNSSHILSANLQHSMQEYRQMLKESQSKQDMLHSSGVSNTSEIKPVPEPEKPPLPPGQIDKTKDAAEERRDISREFAVEIVSLKQKEELFGIYVNATDAEQDASSGVYTPEPTDVYMKTLEYQRRQDLFSALERSLGNPSPENSIMVVV